MNPIIFIDEVDKISKTEHGREIIGILTHLLDSTQNDCFQDKYFNGVDLDLSKALFILSYNDVEAIDKILLDRIHRIQFKNLSLEDKQVIANKHILPEVYAKMGLSGMIEITDEVLKFIIEEYTAEAGVRKLKELLFEIVGEVNLDVLKKMHVHHSFPVKISIEDVKTKYFKERREVKIKKIHPKSEIGVINCLWANELGNGGILSATGKFIPAEKFLDLKLTGLLDEMMRESFHISLTTAYHLLDDETQKTLQEKYNGDKKSGIHMHLGDGSVNKSGTSAGIAIAILFYSLLTQRKIKNDYAVTGEASDLNGTSGEIGALRIKIVSGIKAGVKHFIYPEENQRDFDEFMEKYGVTDLVKGIQFHPITDIREALKLILED
jgi:ATP-dependent Lon protease